MDPLANRKRPADSDNEEDVAIKKQVLSPVETTESPPYDDEEETFADAASTIAQETTEQTATSTDADAIVETHIPYQCLVVLNVEVTCDENPTNPAAAQVTKVRNCKLNKKIN